MAKPTRLHDYLFVFMRKGEWWTYWDLSKMIQQHFGKLYNDNSIKKLKKIGYQGFLIGEKFMASNDPGKELKKTLENLTYEN